MAEFGNWSKQPSIGCAINAETAHPTSMLVTRYIGITPGTSGLRDLLVGLRRELAVRYGQEAPAIPAEDAQLIAELRETLASATAEAVVLGLGPLHQQVLALLGPTCEACYRSTK
jgi:hypothetical protein